MFKATYYAAGNQPPHVAPGDLVLTHANGWVGKLIRFGQRLRFRGEDKPYAYWSHVAIVEGPGGGLIEALGSGVVRSNISKYKDTEYHYISIMPEFTSKDRDQVVAFARWCVVEHEKYGFLTILSIAFKLLTGWKASFFLDGTEICSGLGARAQERTGIIFPLNPASAMPADIAKRYNVRVDSAR